MFHFFGVNSGVTFSRYGKMFGPANFGDPVNINEFLQTCLISLHMNQIGFIDLDRELGPSRSAEEPI